MEATRMREQQQKNYEELKSIIHKMEKKLRYYKSKALIQAVSFLFFHGIILVSVTSMPCRFWWIPFNLSLIPSVLFGLTFTNMLSSYVRAQIEHDFNLVELEQIRYRISMAPEEDEANNMIVNRDKFVAFKIYAYMYFTLFCLLGFTVVVLLACRSIPCG